MRTVLVRSNIVTNAIESASIPNDKFGYDDAFFSDTINIGDVHVNGNYVTPVGEIVEPVSVIPEITSFQAKAALEQFGLLSTIEEYMQSADTLTRLRWEEAITFRRDNQSLLGIAALIGITETQLDDLFILGATIII